MARIDSCDCLRHELIDDKMYGVHYFYDSKGRGTFAYRDCPNPDLNALQDLKDEENRRFELHRKNNEKRLVESVDVNWYDDYKEEWKTPRDWNDGGGIMTRKERFKIWYHTWSNCKKCAHYSACHLYIRDDTHMCPYYDDGVDPEIKMIVKRLSD